MQVDVKAMTKGHFPTELDKPVEIKNEYDLGQEIARLYLKEYGRENIGDVMADSVRTSGLPKLPIPDGASEFYRRLDIQTVVGASKGFVDYLARFDAFEMESPASRRAKMLFSSGWLTSSPNTNFSEMQASKNPRQPDHK